MAELFLYHHQILLTMAIQYVRLTDGSLPVFTFIKELYEGAFPWQERRDWPSLMALLKNPDMQLDLITAEQRPIGFLIWWNIQGWLFIEHFAIAAAERSAGYGAAVMRHYLGMANGKVLLEVEPPVTVDAQRRISFYEKLGLTVLDFPYEQPSYVDQEVYYPMFLMGKLPENEKQGFAEVIEAMKEKVYAKKKLTGRQAF
ncbi:GNAT family N-acetyltransferase [Pedobacter sp.]|uniref:GNAT family N-acetyltransferase n=1 Tax=Pedobacter sp. TaxID=1411316 RepID=UPI003D7FF6C1